MSSTTLIRFHLFDPHPTMPKKARMRRKHYSRKSPEKLAPLAKRLRLSNPNMTTDTTPDANIDQEDSIEHANPKLFEYATPLIFAFPTNLAVGGEFASFRYDCTPWLAERLKDLRLLWRIVDFAHKYRREGNKATPILLLGAALHVQFYAVFPHLETIGETAKCGIFKKWHDEVMHPAFSKTIASRFHYDQVPHKHKSVLLHSGGIDPGDPPTPIDTLVSKAPVNIYLYNCRSL